MSGQIETLPLGEVVVRLVYLVSAVLFVFGLKQMTRVRTAQRGNALAAFAMFLAVAGTIAELNLHALVAIDYRWIAIGVAVGATVGAFAALRVPMTSMPEMVALLNGCGGAASLLVALSVYVLHVVEEGAPPNAVTPGVAEAGILGLSVLIGGITFTGSLVAYGKLKGSLFEGKPILLPARHYVNLGLLGLAVVGCGVFAYVFLDSSQATPLIIGLTTVALILGVLLVIPIGGADMPVVVSLLNSYSGIAAATAGLVLGSNVLIISGAMVGAAGLILTQIMCVAMNRSLLNVLVGGFGEVAGTSSGGSEYKNVRSCGTEEAAMLLENAKSVIIVPGYGLAVAQAQHAVRELGDILEKRGALVRYAIHPVAGRMPGHMNVLLAEADVAYDKLVEMDQINSDFKDTDVVLVLGANDVVNPVALTDKTSPIYGMPILEVHHARSVFVVKRSLGSGYAGIKNVLFEYDNTMMLFGDAKKVIQSLLNEVKQLAA